MSEIMKIDAEYSDWINEISLRFCKCYHRNVIKFRHENVGIYAFLMVAFFFYNDVIFLRRYPVCEATSKKLSHS